MDPLDTIRALASPFGAYSAQRAGVGPPGENGTAAPWKEAGGACRWASRSSYPSSETGDVSGKGLTD